MTSWNDNDLRAIAETKDLFVYPFREDGTTYGTPTRVWPLVVAGDVYVRAANGQQSSWYQAAGGGRRDGLDWWPAKGPSGPPGPGPPRTLPARSSPRLSSASAQNVVEGTAAEDAPGTGSSSTFLW